MSTSQTPASTPIQHNEWDFVIGSRAFESYNVYFEGIVYVSSADGSWIKMKNIVKR